MKIQKKIYKKSNKSKKLQKIPKSQKHSKIQMKMKENINEMIPFLNGYSLRSKKVR